MRNSCQTHGSVSVHRQMKTRRFKSFHIPRPIHCPVLWRSVCCRGGTTCTSRALEETGEREWTGIERSCMCEAVLLTRDGVVDAGPVLTAVSLQPYPDGSAEKWTQFYQGSQWRRSTLFYKCFWGCFTWSSKPFQVLKKRFLSLFSHLLAGSPYDDEVTGMLPSSPLGFFLKH